MSYLSPKVVLGTAILLVGTQVAEAQMTPGGPMGGGGMGQQPAGEEKKEGVAEAAPKTPGLLPTTPALPPPKGRRKRWKLFELDGYFRFRTDWFKNLHLGFFDDPSFGGAPYPRSVGCSGNGPWDFTFISATGVEAKRWTKPLKFRLKLANNKPTPSVNITVVASAAGAQSAADSRAMRWVTVKGQQPA